VAPIYSLRSIPETSKEQDPYTGELVPLRELLRRGKARDASYPSLFTGDLSNDEHFAELKKITSVGAQAF
jgi:hypothetical protein